MSGRIPSTLLALTVVVLALAACGSPVPTTQPTGGQTAPPGATGTLEPPTSVGPPPSPTPDEGTSPLAIDAALLAFLPPDVAGIPVTESLDEATMALGSPVLQEVASAIDAAVAVDTGNANLVYALVVRLREAGIGDEAFRDWRDTYDQGACSAAGMVVGNAEAEIAGRTVYIGTCEGGLRTYHVLIADADLLISAWSLGEGRFGEQLMADLRVEG